MNPLQNSCQFVLASKFHGFRLKIIPRSRLNGDFVLWKHDIKLCTNELSAIFQIAFHRFVDSARNKSYCAFVTHRLGVCNDGFLFFG